jgi:hypothetical protein
MAAIKVSETKYAQSGELSIAYQVFGDGQNDLAYCAQLLTEIWLCRAAFRLRTAVQPLVINNDHFNITRIIATAAYPNSAKRVNVADKEV